MDDTTLTDDDFAMADTVVAQAKAATPAGGSWYDTLASVLPTLVLANSQRQLLNVQLQRAQQGLPPLTSSQYGLGVSVGLDSNTILMIGLGLAAVIAVVMLSRR